MSIKDIRHDYQRLADRGMLQQHMVAMATEATILEAGVVAFHKGYYGDKEWARVTDDVRSAKHAGEEAASQLMEAHAEDVMNVHRILRETLTTTDFAIVLSQMRDRVRRQSYNPIAGPLFASIGPVRTAPNFKPMRGVRTDPFRRLKLQPERTNVEYAELGSTEDGYRVAKYALAVPFSWESRVNDDIGEFIQILFNLGVAANRTRALVLLEAIRDGLARQTPSGTFVSGSAAAGGPTPANIEWAYARFANAVNTNGDPIDRILSHIAIPAQWTLLAKNTLDSDRIVVAGDTDVSKPDGNAVRGLAEVWVERLMRSVFAEDTPDRKNDWLAFDNTNAWVEFAALAGFEAGPQTHTKLADVVETSALGSFDNQTSAVKVMDVVGATITDPTSVVRIAGD